MILRPYQTAAVDAVLDRFRAGDRSTLLVLPTGCGKTIVFSEVARRGVERGRRVLVLAHRTELNQQAQRKLVACGVSAQIEQGAQRADLGASCVVASVQTLSGPRLQRWPRDSFDLVIVDEAHHAIAISYRTILDHFAPAKVLGVSATPDRLDGQGMGEVFQSAAARYELRQAIRDGWLCPIVARRVAVDGLDLAGIHTKAGDLDRAELAAVMAAERALHGVAVPLLELAGCRPTVCFAADVSHAHALAEVLNRYAPNVARAVDGSMKAAERAAILADFAAQRFRVLVNVALLTEGWDCPEVSCVAMARPTKSRALYAQCIGRGTRLAPGKADLLVLDFTGNAGRHRLVGPADVLAGRDITDDVRAEVERLLDGQGDLDGTLDAAEAAATERREQAAVTAIARYRAEVIDPFVGELPDVPNAAWSGDLASDKQREALTNAGLDELPDVLTKGEASRWLAALSTRRSAGLATVRQVRLLKRYGIDARSLTFDEAKARTDEIAANGWRKGWAA